VGAKRHMTAILVGSSPSSNFNTQLLQEFSGLNVASFLVLNSMYIVVGLKNAFLRCMPELFSDDVMVVVRGSRNVVVL
jgi:hypothetical protein